jgi:hypothetical protein
VLNRDQILPIAGRSAKNWHQTVARSPRTSTTPSPGTGRHHVARGVNPANNDPAASPFSEPRNGATSRSPGCEPREWCEPRGTSILRPAHVPSPGTGRHHVARGVNPGNIDPTSRPSAEPRERTAEELGTMSPEPLLIIIILRTIQSLERVGCSRARIPASSRAHPSTGVFTPTRDAYGLFPEARVAAGLAPRPGGSAALPPVGRAASSRIRASASRQNISQVR